MRFSSGHLLVLAAMLIWGSVGIFVRLADQPAATIVFVRVATAFLVIGLYMLISGQEFSLGNHKKMAILSGVAISLNWLFFFKSIQTTTIGNAVLTYYFSPIFSILWARLFLGEKLEHRAAWALLLAAGGIGLMVSNYEFSLTSADFVGIMYGLAGALFYSLVVVMAKGIPGISANNLVLVQMAVSSLIFLPMVVTNPPVLSTVSVAAMLTMGIVHSALALGIYFTGLKRVKVQHASILSYIDPVSAIVYAFICFQETPTLYTAVGGLCILIASFIIIKPPSAYAARATEQ